MSNATPRVGIEGLTLDNARERGLTLPWMVPFLRTLNETGNVRRACEAAGVCRQAAYYFRRKHRRFAAAWAEAMENSIDLLEEAAWERAKDNSDTLLRFLLQGRRADVYGEVIRHQHEGDLGLRLVEEVIVASDPDNPADARPEGIS